ncbi:MAG: PilZ domain-containing protein, partial [Alphaproteobacteria bacterium]|nr:PilZ domain-containing protein [Alphaproteobacteria bacterium]
GIIHVVRSANGDVERRRWPRMQLAGTVEIEIAGAHLSAPILDVSAGGVRISGALPADVGGACRMRLPGVGPELPATILAHSATETRLRFDIDEITRAVVNRMLEDATRDRAAAA